MMIEVFHIPMNYEHTLVLQSKPSPEKLSYHIIFLEVVLRNCRQSKLLCDYFLQNMRKHPIISKKGVIDDKIYTKNRAIRLLNQSKLGKKSKLASKVKGNLGLTCLYNQRIHDKGYFDYDKSECLEATTQPIKQKKTVKKDKEGELKEVAPKPQVELTKSQIKRREELVNVESYH